MTEVNNNHDNHEEEFSFLEVFFHYFRHWKWFVISLVLCLLVAFIYLRYTTREYKVAAKVLIKDDKKGQTVADMSAFQDLGIMSNSSSLDNEIEILKSRSLMYQVKEELNLGVNYFKEGRIKQTEVYNKTPVFVRVNDQTRGGTFSLSQSDANTLNIDSEEEKFHAEVSIPEQWSNPAQMSLPELVVSPWGILSFEMNPFSDTSLPIEVQLRDPKALPEIQITPVNKTSSVVEISIITPNPGKGQDIVNSLVKKYNDQVIEEQNYVATNTIKFIRERLGIISDELSDAERDVERYRREQGVTDLQAQAQMALSSSTEYDRKISDTQIQLSILQGIKDWVQNKDNEGNIAPANVGLTDQTILGLINRYNEEILDKNQATRGMAETNPVIGEYNARIASLRDNLIKGISMAESSLQTNLAELRRQENIYANRARSLPTQERESRELFRQQSIKESLVLYLMQKQEETGLALVQAVPNAVVVDPADYSNVPVKPKTNIIYLAAFLLGLIIPVVVIYVRDLFDNKVRGKEDLQRIVKAPFLGDIPVSTKDQIFPVKNVRSAIAEKFRIISSNLSFITGEKGHKVIMVTSTFSNEGKSFVSRNLALSLATSGKKVLLIDIDMRKSVLDRTLEMHATKGIAHYLSNPDATLKEVTDQKEYHPNLSIIPVKVFPPNPAELMASSRLDELFTQAREQYEYVIVDTAPIGLVADAFRVNEFADATIFVSRADVTYKGNLTDIQSYYKENKLHHLATVLNAVPRRKGYGYGYGGYGYGSYGYGYGEKKHNYYVEED
ncbi:polysaccharide biosynthesis tyrosine autokinase [Bacteroidales bacterium OttesenSCG-928-L03]|nr:polysaccharide biosynthesis tyrosine autokinase [Bacteroidales bacterium OttesenSCG-928-L03]